MKAICHKDGDFIYTDEVTFRRRISDAYLPNFKPDFAPDMLRSCNYICHCTIFKKTLISEVGLFDSEYDGSQDHDMILRLTEKAQHIIHIPEILYYWRASRISVASDCNNKSYAFKTGRKAVMASLDRLGLEGEISSLKQCGSMYRIKYRISGEPKISMIIPNYEHIDDLKKCISSIFSKTTYSNFEIIIVENNSTSEEIFDYYRELTQMYSNVKVIVWNGVFNYSAINNYATEYADGDYYLLLNNDTEVITPDWIQEMLMFVQRKDVGAAGAKLYYPDDTIQHAGVIIGMMGFAGHLFSRMPGYHGGSNGLLIYAQDLSAVTGACMMVRKDVWEQVGGLDENIAVAFNDIDLCLKIRQAGYLIVWTPFAELYHYESKSRGLDDTPEKAFCKCCLLIMAI